MWKKNPKKCSSHSNENCDLNARFSGFCVAGPEKWTNLAERAGALNNGIAYVGALSWDKKFYLARASTI